MNCIAANFLLASVTLRLNLISPTTALGLFVGLGGIIVFLGIRSLAGLGPVRKRALLRKFGSVDAIRDAGVEELAAVVPQGVALRIKELL